MIVKRELSLKVKENECKWCKWSEYKNVGYFCTLHDMYCKNLETIKFNCGDKENF